MVHVRDGNSWKEAVSPAWARDADSYKQAKGIWVRDGESWKAAHPRSLAATWDNTNCEADLNWTADNQHDQDIYRCSGSACDPQSGSKVTTVAAGVSSYSDNGPTASSGDWTYQIVSSNGESNTNTTTAGDCGGGGV